MGWLGDRGRRRSIVALFGLSLLLGGFAGGRAFAAERSGPALIGGHRSHLTIPTDDWAYLYAAYPNAGTARGVDKRPKSSRVSLAALAGGLALGGLSLFVVLRHPPAPSGSSRVPARRRAPRAPPLPLPF